MRSAFLNRCDDDDATKETNEGEGRQKGNSNSQATITIFHTGKGDDRSLYVLIAQDNDLL